MSVRQFSLTTLTALLLTLGGALVIQEVRAQRACTDDTACASLGREFRCVSSRCNLPPPIWNVSGTGLETSGQGARIFLQGAGGSVLARFGDLQFIAGNQLSNVAGGEVAVNWSPAGGARLGRGFTVYDGGEGSWFRIDDVGTVSIARGLNVGAVTGAPVGEIRVQGNIVAGGQLRLALLGADPAAATSLRGGLYFNTASNAVRVYSGAAWQDLGGAAGAVGCFGPVFQQGSTEVVDGDIDGAASNGYVAANGKCSAGMHVCTTSEMLMSINCGRIAGRGLTVGQEFWLSNGAPSLPTPTNDCLGWTTNSAEWRGIKWQYQVSGGAFYAEACNVGRNVACCQ